MVNPLGMELIMWADSISVDFPNDNIPVLTDEKNWKMWGEDLVAAVTFSQNGAPSPAYYEDWFSWAQEVYYTMNNN